MLLPTCYLAHSDDVRCNSCSPEAIWGKLTEDDRMALVALRRWPGEQTSVRAETLARMQTQALCEVKQVGEQPGTQEVSEWDLSELGLAVVEYGIALAQGDADREDAFMVILGERDNLGVPQIWEGLSAEAKRWVLDPSQGASIHPAYELSEKGLTDRHMMATSLAGHVAEHGRAQ